MSCGLLIERSSLAEAERAVHLVGTNINVVLVDVCAEVTLEQKFVLRASGSEKTRYVLPLEDSSFLSGVEVIVDGEKRISVDKDCNEVQRIVDSRKLENAKNIYSFIIGDVPGGKEIRIKCMFTTELSVEGDQIFFSFPAQALPRTIDEQAAEGLQLFIKIEANSDVLGVTCESHPDKFSTDTLLLSDNTAQLRMSLAEGFSPNDIVFQYRIKDPHKPRIWTSVGTVQGKRKRVSALVVYPALAPEKSGLEVVFAIDAHESVDPCQPSLEAALKSLPQWVTFNIWAHLQNSVFGPVFDVALPSTAANIEHAISKLKSLQTLGGVASIMETLLASPTSGFPRQIYLLTSSKGSRLADLLGLLSKYSTTTRSIVVRNGSHDGKGEVATLINESIALDSPRAFEQGFTSKLPPAPTIAASYKSPSRHSCTNELIYCSPETLTLALPGLISRTVVPAQFLTVESVVPAAFSVDHSRSAIYQNHVHLFYSTKDNIDSSIDVVVDDAPVSVFTTHSSVFHHLAALSLLRGEFGYIQDSKEKRQNLTRFCSPWTPFISPTAAKGKHLVAPIAIAPNTAVNNIKKSLSPRSPQRSISESSIESPVVAAPSEPKAKAAAAAAAMFKSAPSSGMKRPTLMRATSAGDDLRAARLGKHLTVQNTWAPTAVDYSSRSRVPCSELEAVAMDMAVSLVKTDWEVGRQLTVLETQRVRSLVTAIIEGEGPSRHQIVLQSEAGPEVDVPKLQDALIGSFKRSWTPTLEVGSQHKYRAYVYAEKGARSHMEDQFVILDNINELVGKPSAFSPPTAFFGVFDGHLGKFAAEYARLHLPFKLLRSSQFHPAGLADALREAYTTTDKDFVALARQDGQKSGTTVVTTLLFDNKIAVSNAGDSEAVLCRGGKAVCLTIRHNPANEQEKLRIEASGGKIFFYGTQRVNGVLAVTRSIGDSQMKDQIISDPHTVIQQLEADDEFIILATDGLWDVLNYQEAVDWVRAEYNKNKQSVPGKGFNVSKGLTDEAVKRGTKDNVTAIVVFFNS